MRMRIFGGRVIDPANGVDRIGDVCIDDDRIVSVGSTPQRFSPSREIDAEGHAVCPGLVDLSARLREPGATHKADIDSETRAAARGGITTLCCPPDTDPVIDTPAVVELIHQRAAENGACRVEVLGALTSSLAGESLAQMGALKQAGCLGVSNALRPVHDTEVMRRAMEYAATFEMTVFVHAEDAWLADRRLVHDGPVATRLGLPGIPEVAETIALARELLLVEHTGARVHFSHLSTGPAVDMIRDARRSGLPVSADVAVPYLHLTSDNVAGFDGLFHVRPPLRTEDDRARLRRGVADGTLVAVCSDHQPHETDAKQNPFADTEPGISGLETLLPLTLELIDAGVTDLPTAIASLTYGPAGVLGIDRGHLTPGASADLCIFDPQGEWQLQANTMRSRGHNTPFLDRPLKGRVKFTVLGGKVVYQARDDEVAT